ncbi:hypothetical protein CPB84DRAFT_1743507 [Gymnopilus junonius]|uniref:Zinc finger PHD-type domain-containing protein n=1 Tax=Gymnopilus junonius TaxID=109634 RepID=A0A9P5NXD5_GYMJU|nr:hypothetical protein CPB84DRAFT_1743507 [Gymnopilus junonius]
MHQPPAQMPSLLNFCLELTKLSMSLIMHWMQKRALDGVDEEQNVNENAGESDNHSNSNAVSEEEEEEEEPEEDGDEGEVGNKVGGVDDGSVVCNDPGCGIPIEDVNLVQCLGPGCKFVYHLTCRGLFEKPKTAWFCNDDCRKNAGFRVAAKQKK